MLLFKLAFFLLHSTILKWSYNMAEQKKHIYFVTLYVLLFFLWITFVPRSWYGKEIGILFLFYFATFLSCFYLYKTIRQLRGEKKLFWILILCTCLCGFIMELTLFLQSRSIYNQPLFSFEAMPFFILQYVLLFIGFTIKFTQLYSFKGLFQFLFDSIFIMITTIFFTLKIILNIPTFHEATNEMWILTGYFIAQSLVIYAVISLYRREEHSASRVALIIGFSIIIIYGYIHIFCLTRGIELSAALIYFIHTTSILSIGLSSLLYVFHTPMKHETKTKYYDFDYVRVFLPYFNLLLILIFSMSDFSNSETVLIGFSFSLVLLFFRQFYIWKGLQKLIHTYEGLNAQLATKVAEGICALSKSEQQYKSLFEDHPDAVFSLDLDVRFQSTNTTCANLFKIYDSKNTGYSLLHFIDSKDHALLETALQHTKEGLPQTLEVQTKTEKHLQVTLIPILVEEVVVGMFGIARNITELHKKQQQIKHLAFHDALTELPNRRKFEKALHVALHKASEQQTSLAVLFVDLDRFKKINDRFGHDVGDLLLVEVAKRLEDCLHTKDIVARQGGDEFTLLLPDIHSTKNAALIAEQLLKALNRPFILNNIELSVTPSIGIAMYPDHGTHGTELMKHADIAMYCAKATGKNKFAFFSNEMSIVESETQFLESELAKALQQNEFFLQYQPQVNTKTKQIIGFEALVRWNHPKLGMVSPEQFIPIAEETGFIIELGHWILRSACQEAKKWHDQGFTHLKVGVNLSVAQFNHPELIPTISSVLQETQLNPQALDLEITESIAINNEQSVIENLNQLQKLGIQISIDDFGTGYSSLAYLTKYPIHTLKIAKEFIHGIENNPIEEAITSSIITLAKNLQLTVIAEGVETPEQWSFLYHQNCDQIQGFLISKPVHAHEVLELLQKDPNLQIT